MHHERPRNGSINQLYNQVATSTTAAIAVPASVVDSRQDVTILNMDAAITIYIGDSALTTSNGFPLAAGASITRRFFGAVWAVAASGTPKLAYITTEDP